MGIAAGKAQQMPAPATAIAKRKAERTDGKRRRGLGGSAPPASAGELPAPNPAAARHATQARKSCRKTMPIRVQDNGANGRATRERANGKRPVKPWFLSRDG